MSQTTKTSQSNSSGMGLDERLEVALGLLHPLEDQLDRARRLAVEDPQGAQVGHQPALVVGGAAAVDPAVLVGRRPRVGRPALLRRGGLHVVVGVEHDDRGALRAPGSRRRSAGSRMGTSISRAFGEPDLAEQLRASARPSAAPARPGSRGRRSTGSPPAPRGRSMMPRHQRAALPAISRNLHGATVFLWCDVGGVGVRQKKMAPIAAPTATVVTRQDEHRHEEAVVEQLGAQLRGAR